MIKYIINAIKAAQEQQRQQAKLSTLLKIDKKDSIKVRLPKNYIEMLEVIARSGINKPNTLDALIKGEVRYIKHEYYDICEFTAILDQDTSRFRDEQLNEQAMYYLIKEVVKDHKYVRSERQQRISPYHHRVRYSIKVAVERK